MLNVKKMLNLAAKNGMTLKDLSKRADVSMGTLNRIVRHGKRVQLPTIGRLAEALGCEPSYLLED